MNRSGRALTSVLLAACAGWTLAPTARETGTPKVHVTGAGAALVARGLALPAPEGAALAGFEEVPAPGVRFVPTAARSTNVPWIDSNGWRYTRGLSKAHYAALPAGTAPLAAAEAFAFGVEALLNPDPGDVEELGLVLEFLRMHERPRLPVVSDIAVVDSDLPVMGEVLNMLTRRNLLYRVTKDPAPSAALVVRIGTDEFPEDAAINPHEFALMVRERLGDDRRTLRLYGTSTVIARFTGDGKRARLFLLAYSPRRQQQTVNAQAMQVRLLGKYQPRSFAGYGTTAGAAVSDLRHPDGATEFWVPDFQVCAIVDLDALH